MHAADVPDVTDTADVTVDVIVDVVVDVADVADIGCVVRTTGRTRMLHVVDGFGVNGAAVVIDVEVLLSQVDADVQIELIKFWQRRRRCGRGCRHGCK